LNYQTATNAEARRILELEIENARLQKLVAELLIKNQELREGVGRPNSTVTNGLALANGR
jgi:hypothetical protein